MWIEVYTEHNYAIEKKIEETEEIKRVREYIEERAVGSYRLVEKISRKVLCGSSYFNKVLQWISHGIPELYESLSEQLNLGVFIKSYESKSAVVIISSKSVAIFTEKGHRLVEYRKIRKIETEQKSIYIYTEGDMQDNREDRIGCEYFYDLDRELITLSLSPVDEDTLPHGLLFRRISQRLCATIPLYNQDIQAVVIYETGSISVSNDFIIIKEEEKYLAIPLSMVRKVEIVDEWQSTLRIKDANCRVFEFVLVDKTGIERFLGSIQRDDTKFKITYFSVLFDMVEHCRAVNCDLDRPGSWSMGNSSEYKIYLCMKMKEPVSISVGKSGRPFFWFACLCLCAMAHTPGLYELSVERSAKEFHSSYAQIDKDVNRTVLGGISSSSQKRLAKVLYAFAAFTNNEYLQSHAMIGGVLYRVLGEAGSFYGLVHIFTRILPEYTGPDIYGMRRDISVFIDLTKEKYPGLYENLSEKSIGLEILVTPWILSLFTTIFQQNQIERVFDHIVYYGSVFVFKLALALLERMYVGLSRSKETGSILKTSANYFFKNKSAPSMEEKEFIALLNTAKADSFITPDLIQYKRQQYELLHRRDKIPL